MLNGYESVFESLLKQRLEDILVSKRVGLESGYPEDFPAYRELVGYLKALKDFNAVIEAVNDSMNKPEEN